MIFVALSSGPMLGLSQHARQRMAERRITEAEIEEALDHWTYSVADDDLPEERTLVYGLTLGGRRLKVVVESADLRYVITVMDQDEEA